MGHKYGPMVIAGEPMTIDQLRGKRIAIPGKLTTAFLALQLCLGKGRAYESHAAAERSAAADPSGEAAFTYDVVHFDQIPKYVKEGRADAGLIIHEGQLTYQKLGLKLIVDLGAWWHDRTSLPLPLGGNCIRKDLGPQACQEVTDVLKRSIQYSLDHRAEAVE